MNEFDSEKSRFLRWLKSEFEQAAIEFHAGDADRWRRIWSRRGRHSIRLVEDRDRVCRTERTS
jgi:hypothetical protein